MAKRGRPKARELPGMEGHNSFPEIDKVAEEYAEIRDQRMELLEEEVKLKGTLLEKMKERKIKVYKHDGIEVLIVAEEETVKVKIHKAKKTE